MQQDQITAQQQQAEASLAEQKRQFDIQQQQAAQSLDFQREQQRIQQAEADLQASLSNVWAEGRAFNTARAADTVNQSFAAFTPEYYQGFTKAYTDHYQPEVERQYDTATQNTRFGLARTGNLESQTAADQAMQLAIQKGVAQSDINNSAIGATNALKTNVVNAKNALMGQATSDSVIGSPITPGTASQIEANWSGTDAKIGQISNQAGDIVNTVQATPAYSSLGSLFGSLATSGSSALTGANAFNNYQAFQRAAGASNPTSSSGRVG